MTNDDLIAVHNDLATDLDECDRKIAYLKAVERGIMLGLALVVGAVAAWRLL